MAIGSKSNLAPLIGKRQASGLKDTQQKHPRTSFDAPSVWRSKVTEPQQVMEPLHNETVNSVWLNETLSWDAEVR